MSGFELSVLPVSSNMSEHSVYPVLVKKSVVESFACPAPTYGSECELSTCLMSLTEMSTSPVSVNAPGFDLSARPLPPSVFNPELSVYTKVCTVPVRESNIELSVQPLSRKPIQSLLPCLSKSRNPPWNA